MEESARYSDVKVTFEKLKTINNSTRSFICFLTMSCGDQTYRNMAHGVTLESATEKLALLTLRQNELLGSNIRDFICHVR